MPSFHRWTPAFTMLLVSLISYVDRNTLAILAPSILQETGLNAQQYGFIISAFSVAYTLANPVWGRILDRVGLRHGMTAAVSWWTAASVAHAFAGGVWSFGAARAALGLGEGATFPGGLRTVVQTLPPENRGRGLAVAYSGGSLGAIVAPLVVTPVFLRWGWRGAFWLTGMIGVAWLALWAVVGRRPDISGVRISAGPAVAAPRFSDPRLWAFMSAYALGALPLGFVLYAASLYLANPLGYSQERIGRILWIPPLGWEAGYFVWGWLQDRGRSPGSMMAVCAVFSLLLAAVPRMTSLAAVMAVLFLTMFVAAGFVVLPVAYATRVYSPDHAGFIAGAGAGSWSFLVGVMMPLLGRLFDIQRHAEAFWIVSVIPICGYVAWLTLSRLQAQKICKKS